MSAPHNPPIRELLDHHPRRRPEHGSHSFNPDDWEREYGVASEIAQDALARIRSETKEATT